MAITALVTGSAGPVGEVVAALRAAGAEAMGVADADQGISEAKAFSPGSLDCYVQLPVVLNPAGDTVVARVHEFLDQGLLTRFRLAEAVLAALSDEGRVVLVGGHTPIERATPDDQAARTALLEVLAHAIRADKAPAKVRVRVLGHGHDASEIARLVLTGAPVRGAPVLHGAEPGRRYLDWRTEVLGLVSAEF